MHRQFESLTEDNEFIVLNNIVFNANKIKTSIIGDFKPKKNNLNFCRKNLFLRKYFIEINNQGIFNRIEWKFWLKEDIQCKLITVDKIIKLEELQIKVILDFSSPLNKNNEYCDLKVLLYFSLQELETKQTTALKSIHEQNTAYFYPLSSEKICI